MDKIFGTNSIFHVKKDIARKVQSLFFRFVLVLKKKFILGEKLSIRL